MWNKNKKNIGNFNYIHFKKKMEFKKKIIVTDILSFLQVDK